LAHFPLTAIINHRLAYRALIMPMNIDRGVAALASWT